MTAPLVLLASESSDLGPKFAVGFVVLAIFMILLMITLIVGGGRPHGR
jgi:hypothetical protein